MYIPQSCYLNSPQVAHQHSLNFLIFILTCYTCTIPCQHTKKIISCILTYMSTLISLSIPRVPHTHRKNYEIAERSLPYASVLWGANVHIYLLRFNKKEQSHAQSVQFWARSTEVCTLFSSFILMGTSTLNQHGHLILNPANPDTS